MKFDDNFFIYSFRAIRGSAGSRKSGKLTDISETTIVNEFSDAKNKAEILEQSRPISKVTNEKNHSSMMTLKKEGNVNF